MGGWLEESQGWLVKRGSLGFIRESLGFIGEIYTFVFCSLICLQDRQIISSSVVNITGKLRCCQHDLGRIFLNDWKELFKNKTKLGNNFIYLKES